MKQHEDSNLRLCLFLGSGASAFSGYQTFATFRELIFDEPLRQKEQLPELHPETAQIIKQIDSELRRSDRPPTHDNYLWALQDYQRFCESFHSHRFVQDTFTTMWNNFGQFSLAINHAIDDITRITLCHYAQNRVGLAERDKLNTMRKVAGFYHELGAINDWNRPFLPAFTTNYDLLLEDMATANIFESDFPVLSGFTLPLREASPWTEESFDSQEGGFHLYRAHGCVCWFNREPQRVYFHRDALQQNWRSEMCVMIPGREICRGHLPHSAAFRRFFQTLKTVDVVIFIGFSFRDDDIMHILLAGAASRESKKPLKVLIANPNLQANEVQLRLRGAMTRSVFPAHPVEDIQVVPCLFGYDDFDSRILSAVETLIA
jgi:hypothetical protein